MLLISVRLETRSHNAMHIVIISYAYKLSFYDLYPSKASARCSDTCVCLFAMFILTRYLLVSYIRQWLWPDSRGCSIRAKCKQCPVDGDTCSMIAVCSHSMHAV